MAGINHSLHSAPSVCDLLFLATWMLLKNCHNLVFFAICPGYVLPFIRHPDRIRYSRVAGGRWLSVHCCQPSRFVIRNRVGQVGLSLTLPYPYQHNHGLEDLKSVKGQTNLSNPKITDLPNRYLQPRGTTFLFRNLASHDIAMLREW